MKNSIAIKFIAILLAAFTLVGAVLSAVGVALLSWQGLYTATGYEQWQEQEVAERAQQLAGDMLLRWCIENHSNVPESVCREYLFLFAELEYDNWLGLVPEGYGYTITSAAGQTVHSYGKDPGPGYTYTLRVEYPMLAEDEFYDYTWYFEGKEQKISFVESPEYTVTVYMTADSLSTYEGIPVLYLKILFRYRYWLIALLGVCMVVFAACAVYLCYVAGRSRHSDKVAPGALNRIPLDIYLAAGGGISALLLYLSWLILDYWVIFEAVNVGGLALATMALLVVAVILIGFFFAVAAQAKMGKVWWLRHTLIGTLCVLLFKGIRFIIRAIGRLFSLMPLIWQYVVACLAMGGSLLFTAVLCASSGTGFAIFLLLHTILGCTAIICYGGYALGTILRGARRMHEGDLQTKINTRYLLGSYKKGAEDLNALADAAVQAAERQLKSERMKTELITNVSHDIKTPLTSIINYVDLLEKPHTEEEQSQYLEVLGRQSQRLKKLVEDLMEMSKATTGNMAVEVARMDAAEMVNQALGEFSDKLAAAQLSTVFQPPEQPATVWADGRLLWRVLSNLLSNIVKYALPGTRVYIDIHSLQDQVLISLKNISREPLNMSAEELKERFVRGDASRNTEGSGLGLNIAQSLMELQKGQLHLLVDGDLFKVTLSFPSA